MTFRFHQDFLKNNKNPVKKKITKNKNYFRLGRPLNSYKFYVSFQYLSSDFKKLSGSEDHDDKRHSLVWGVTS